MTPKTTKTKNKYDPKIKQQIINLVRNEGLSGAECARQFGINLKTIYNWLALEGKSKTLPIVGDLAKGRNPNSNPRHKSDALVIAKLRRENAEMAEMVGKMALLLEKIKKKEIEFTLSGR
jgi:transposase-like protein